MLNAKTIYVVSNSTFNNHLADKKVTVTECDLVDIVCKLDNYQLITNDPEFAKRLGDYLMTTIEVKPLEYITARNMRGFIASPPVMGFDWDWEKVVPESVAQQVANILSMREMSQMA